MEWYGIPAGDSTPYDQLDYKNWVSAPADSTFRRHRERKRRSVYAPALAECYETCRSAGSKTCAELTCCPSNTTDTFTDVDHGFYVCQADSC